MVSGVKVRVGEPVAVRVGVRLIVWVGVRVPVWVAVPVRVGVVVRVPVADGPLTSDEVDAVAQRFHEAHRGLYGYDFAGDGSQPVEWVNLRVSGVGPITRPEIPVHRARVETAVETSSAAIETAFDDAVTMYNGAHRDFHPCDTEYHDLQHVLDVTLAMARLMDGYERGRFNGTPALPAKLFTDGVIAALFHDVGYLRHKRDDQRRFKVDIGVEVHSDQDEQCDGIHVQAVERENPVGERRSAQKPPARKQQRDHECARGPGQHSGKQVHPRAPPSKIAISGTS